MARCSLVEPRLACILPLLWRKEGDEKHTKKNFNISVANKTLDQTKEADKDRPDNVTSCKLIAGSIEETLYKLREGKKLERNSRVKKKVLL
jgi:hypothetical protein